VTQVPIVECEPGSPYQTFDQLLAAMRQSRHHGGDRGQHLSGHIAMEAIAKATGVKYRHVTYDGGNPAVISTWAARRR
jgi:tripartite-type tricarboxylate transporter receptor subunit TctC